MKKDFLNVKFIWVALLAIGMASCNSDDDSTGMIEEPLPALTSGEADFSKYVSIGNSLTAGYADGALYAASQMNSFPNLLAYKFALVGGGEFTQPWMNDNVGGLLLGGTVIASPRLYFDTTTFSPVPVSGMPSTEVSSNIYQSMGPFNNMGVPGAKVGHLLFDGYGNIGGIVSGTANPYFVRMASSSSTTVIQDAMVQNPTFISLWIGNNDVLGYALSGGDGTSPITPLNGSLGIGFTETYNYILGALASTGAKGVVGNIPDVTTIPHFTTVPYNPVPLDSDTANLLNAGYAQYNAGLQLAQSYGLIDADEVTERTIAFAEAENNALVIVDEYLTDLSSLGIPSYRQATATDLFVLPLSSLIPNGYGTQIPLEDKWALVPEELDEISQATAAFNQVIDAARQQYGFALLDANSLMSNLANGGVSSGDFTLNANFATGGAFSLDGVHPTSRGYSLIANEVMRSIDMEYGSNFEASGNLYDIGDFPTNFPNGI